MSQPIAEIYHDFISKYDVICFVDLADMAGSHSAIFSLLRSYYRSEYQSNQRLIFYSSHEVSQDLINHLQRAACKVDISNYFIVICCPHELEHKLKVANANYGNDRSTMSFVKVDIETTKSMPEPGFYPRYSFCPLPFSSVILGTSGSVSPCCKFKGYVGNIAHNTLNEIFHNDQMDELRYQMKTGIKPQGCQVCWETENTGVTSMRQHFLNKYGDLCDNGWADNIKIRSLDVSPSSLCNFKCRICFPNSSTQIAVEQLQHATDVREIAELKNLLQLSNWNTYEQFQTSMAEITQDLQYLHIMGGEPFLLPQLPEVLQKIIDQGHAQHLELDFNTNGSVWPEKIIPLFEKFQRVEILVSVDNVGQRFEIERGGSWPGLRHHLEQYSKLTSSSIVTKLAVTVNVQNLLYLDDIVELARNLGFEIVWWYLESPDYLCIDHVTAKVKQLVGDKYHGHTEPELVKIARRVQSTPAADGGLFVDYMDKLDRRRNQDFRLSHQEIYDAMKNSSEAIDF